MREWIARLLDWFRRGKLDRELDEELAFHRAHLERDALRHGADADAAAHTARRRLGNATRLRETMRERWSIPPLDIWQQDVRYAIRGLRRSPGFSTTVVITLALGIGANAAMFNVVDRLMFRPLAFLQDPGTAHRIYWQWWNRGSMVTTLSTYYTRYLDLRNWTDSFTQFAAFDERNLAVGEGTFARERRVGVVSAEFFDFFDARPVVGRFFTADEDVTPKGSDVAVLSHRFWQAEFGGRDVLGEQLRVGDISATVIGVAPEGFAGVNDAIPPAVYIPITTFAGGSQTEDARTYFSAYRWGWVEILVRRKPGIPVEDAARDATNAFRRSWLAGMEDYPQGLSVDAARPRAIVSSVRTGAGPAPSLEARTALWVSAVSGIVLLIACANVANLLLARAFRRRHETALRLALGGSRRRLILQTLSEILLLTIASGVAGLVVVQWGGTAVRGLLITADPSLTILTDGRTLLITLGLAAATGLLVSWVPVISVKRRYLAHTLRSGSRGGGVDGTRIRSALLVGQGALTVVLLVGAVLFVRSLQGVQNVPMGYDVDRVLLVNRIIRGPAFEDSVQVPLRRHLLSVAQALPQVESAAWVSSAPFVSTSATDLYVAGIDSVGLLGTFTYQATTPDYFRTMGTRILRGRGLTNEDRVGTPDVAVVSESMAERLWPNRRAIGQCFRMRSDTAPCVTVVGVAEDMVQQDIVDGRRYHYYLSADQYRRTWGRGMVLRLRGDVLREADNIRQVLQREMTGPSYLTVQPLRDIVDGQQRSWRMGATMFVAFGGLALIVAAIGLYGVLGYNVAQRMHELGVRVALGARPRDIVLLVMRQATRVAGIAVVAGSAIALAGATWIEPLLFRQSARDPLIYGLVAAGVVGVAVLATAVPARRASRADPNAVLRTD
jgi:predicted permease